MPHSTETAATEAVAEAQQTQRQRRSAWVLASGAVARYRAHLLPTAFALIILVPGLMMLVDGRDLASVEQAAFDLAPLGALPTLIGRVGTLAILALVGLAIFAWFASAHRRQLRGRVAGRPRGRVTSQARAARDSDRADGDKRRASTRREASIRARMLLTSLGNRVTGPAEMTGSATATAETETAAVAPPALPRLRRTSKASLASVASRRAGNVSSSLSMSALLFVALLYHFTNTILPELTGTAATLSVSSLYFPLVAVAIFCSRRLPRRRVFAVTQWSIAAYLLAGLALAYVEPSAALTTAGLEQRLSFLDSRFWGVGSNPNSVAPMAVLQLILQARQPWRPNIFWLVGNVVAAAAAVVVLVWAQSQTTWAAAALLLPWALIRSRLDRKVNLTSIQPHHALIGLLGVLIAAVILAVELIASDATGKLADAVPAGSLWQGDAVAAAARVGDEYMTGRGLIWSTALDVWRDHPWLGFGSTAWSYDFRAAYGLPQATSAHSQWMQALSVSGLIGAITLLIYAVLLGHIAWRTSGESRGLSLALLGLLMVRTITEVPLETRVLLSSDLAQHLALLFCLFVYGSDVAQRTTQVASKALR